MGAVSLPPERRRQLQLLGLRALAKRWSGDADDERPVHFVGGVALALGPLVAVFADHPSALGAAIDAASHEKAERLLFFAETNDGTVARRAAEFIVATIVIDPNGAAQALEPAPVTRATDMPASLDRQQALFEEAGLETTWEHGVLLGEYLGLEVARATIDGHVDVGVGKHDREGNRVLHPEGPTLDAIVEARRMVAELRRPGARPHPANQLVPERWLRTVLIAHPDLVGEHHLEPVPPPAVRDDLRRRGVAPAVGDGTVVVCSVGVDPDLVAQAADCRLHADAGCRLVIAVPEGDNHPLTRRLARLLRRPAEIITVPADWRAS
jgi:hypothetical protein